MYCVELVSISKSFGGIAALKDVTFKVRSGEIHALVGENGAGKSTLMKILSGAYTKDSGKIRIDNKEVSISNTHESKNFGIGIIYQEFSLVPHLSVAENIFLHQLGAGSFWLKWSIMKRDAVELINNLGFKIDPTIPVNQLSIAHQQIVEIAKALSEKVKVLILDEPSAVLGPYEIEKLFDTLIRLKNEGVAIIYISHHLDEIFQISDRVTVLKDGISSDSFRISEVDKNKIIEKMLGRSIETMYPFRDSDVREEALKVVNIQTHKNTKKVSFSVNKGEVLGIAGLVGSGRTEIARAIFSADEKTSGQVFVYQKKMHINSPCDAIDAGIGMVPEDRKRHGVILSMSIKQNISLTNFKALTNSIGFIRSNKEITMVSNLIRKLSIKSQDANTIVKKLSGGNQQKVVLAKWMTRNCKVMIIDEPTRGVDVGGKIEIYKLINQLSKMGVATIVISSETAELMGICDRILVMRDGEIRGELDKKEFSEEQILRLSIGA